MTDFQHSTGAHPTKSVALRYDGVQAPSVVATGAGEVAEGSSALDIIIDPTPCQRGDEGYVCVCVYIYIYIYI